jgi:Pyridoxamine 5'-phosphate oxidase
LSVRDAIVACMVAWRAIEADAPDFAARVRELFQARKHKTMATLREDGSPRISGIETQIGEHVTFGSMPDSRKLADLKRDPRLALHSPSVDPPEDDPGAWVGEAKISGRAVPTEDEFMVDITEVALTYLDDGLVIESWHPGRGHARHVRD